MMQQPIKPPATTISVLKQIADNDAGWPNYHHHDVLGTKAV